MAEWNTIKFRYGKPRTLTLTFDEPIIKDKPSKFKKGETYKMIMYGVKDEDGKQASFFADEKLHFLIQQLGLRKGEVVDIVKQEGEDDTHYYEINYNSQVSSTLNLEMPPEVAGKPAGAPTVIREENPAEADLEHLDYLYGRALSKTREFYKKLFNDPEEDQIVPPAPGEFGRSVNTLYMSYVKQVFGR